MLAIEIISCEATLRKISLRDIKLPYVHPSYFFCFSCYSFHGNWGAIDRSKYGYRMLEQMGWSEGKGLGVKEDGDTQHIRISKKSDMSGQSMKFVLPVGGLTRK